MAKKDYDWSAGAELDEHSKRKHKILREYLREYLITRCQLPQQEKFRLTIVDGFSGAGKYKCGSPGSPLILLDCLKSTVQEINLERAAQGMKLIEVECLLIFNDLAPAAIELLKENIAPLVAEAKDTCPQLHVRIEFSHSTFKEAYPEIKSKIQLGKYRNVLFNLDQCGYSDVDLDTIKDILFTWKSAEAFLNFPIETVKTFISPDKNKSSALKSHQKIRDDIYAELAKNGGLLSKADWLGEVERIVFENLKGCAPYASPFSIHNPDGWRYWLIHFANNYRARQVYNNILHENSTMQAHFGRSGLHMLSYDPSKEGELYLFNDNSRENAKKQLFEDIPRLINEHGDVLSVEIFYEAAYNETPAHSNDIHEMIILNPDLEVITPAGNERRKANTIRPEDTLRLKRQTSFFPRFFDRDVK